MFLRPIAAVLAAATLVLLGGGAANPTTGPVTGKQSQSQKAQWESLNSSVGHFTALMPPGATYSKEEIYIAEANVTLVYHTYVGEVDPYSAYLINFIDYPSIVDVSNPQDHFDGSLAGLQSGMPNGHIVWMKNTQYQGMPAQDFVIKGDGGQIFGRMIMKESTLFLLVGSFADGSVNPQQFNAFLNGFQMQLNH